jgi:pimeloyl-ACP methyl ester carboxylesterase
MSTEKSIDRKHYVLVHGSCHGAWCWYKVKPLLESAGHLVTLVDLAASGTNLKKIEDVNTISEYTKPLLQLMATIPPNEKVILVGHSFGGLSIALCYGTFSRKGSCWCFLNIFYS